MKRSMRTYIYILNKQKTTEQGQDYKRFTNNDTFTNDKLWSLTVPRGKYYTLRYTHEVHVLQYKIASIQ